MEIRYVNEGIANRYDEVIELNENLKKYPKLHDFMLKHEMDHTSTEGFTKQDFLLDINPGKISYRELMKFMIKNPKSFYQLLPFYKRNNIVFYDINLIISWTVVTVIIGLAVYFAWTI